MHGPQRKIALKMGASLPENRPSGKRAESSGDPRVHFTSGTLHLTQCESALNDPYKSVTLTVVVKWRP